MTEEKRNILDIICSGRKPTLPLTVEEASILYAVFTACHKLNIREIMVEEKREELE